MSAHNLFISVIERDTAYEIREEVQAYGGQYHERSVLVHERAGQVSPADIIVETCEIAFSRATSVVFFYGGLFVTVPVVGYNAAVYVILAKKSRLVVLYGRLLYDDAGNASPP